MVMDCSIVIPIRNEYPSLVFTVDSVLADLKRCGLQGEVLLVFNENTDKGLQYMRMITHKLKDGVIA